MVQSVGCPALDFGSGHDLLVRETEPCIGLFTEHGSCLGFSLSLSLCPSPAYALHPPASKKTKKQKPFTVSGQGAPGWLSQLSSRLLISAQVMISRFMRSSLRLGSVLTMRSLLGILCLSPSLPAPPLLVSVHAVSLSLSFSLSK